MNRIKKTFNHLINHQRTALMPYLTMGFPQLESAKVIVPALVKAGADLIELGVPFSDPLADGATIQLSSQRALENGVTLKICLEQAAEIRNTGITTPFVLMGYYNPIFQYGIHKFASDAAASGIDGVIIPDLPPDEAKPLADALKSKDMCTIFLLAPTSDKNRIRLVAGMSEGFVYLVSLVGVTGSRDKITPNLREFVDRVRQETQKPLTVGFGISTPQHAANVSQIADGVIVGSALIQAINKGADPARDAFDFIKSLRISIDAGIG